MSKWEMMKLGDISDVITKGTTPTSIGYHFENDGINFLKIESIREDGSFIKEKLQYISEECNEKLKRSILRENDILFSIAGALGRSAVVTTEILPANINQALAIIRIKQRMAISQYVQYVLKSHFVFRQFQKQKQGVAQLNLSLKNISDIAIPLPPLEVQQKIAQTLDAAAELIALRKEQLEALDKLIKSVFYEMFGDPVTNEKGWQVIFVQDVYTIIDGDRGVNYPKQNDFINDGYCLFLNTGNVTKEGFKFDDLKFISEEKDKELRKGKMERGDVILTTRGTVGNIAYYNKDIAFNVVRINSGMVILRNRCKEIHPLYFCELFKNKEMGRRISSFLSGTAQPQLPITNLKKIRFPLPPLSRQNQFAEIVTKIEEQKVLVQKAIDESQYLFDSLMNEYFN